MDTSRCRYDFVCDNGLRLQVHNRAVNGVCEKNHEKDSIVTRLPDAANSTSVSRPLCRMMVAAENTFTGLPPRVSHVPVQPR
jgi:hypothetical protein